MLIEDTIPIRRQQGRSSTVSQSSSGATRHFDSDAQSPTTASPQHLHPATWQLQRWSQRIDRAPPLQQGIVAFCWEHQRASL